MNMLFQDETNEKVEVVSHSSDNLKKKFINHLIYFIL